MLKGQKVTAVIPARKGSKGIPGKNQYKLGNDSLLERTIKIALLCHYIDSVVVSTDCQEMYEVAKRFGCSMSRLRPAELATDSAKTVDVVLDVVSQESVEDGWVILLQVTSPLRRLSDLDMFCNRFEESSKLYNGAVSIVHFDSPHPDKIQIIDGGSVRSYLGKESMVARQSLPTVYALNGAFYLTSVKSLQESKSFLSGDIMPFVMPSERSVNLDTQDDLKYLEFLYSADPSLVEEYDV